MPGKPVIKPRTSKKAAPKTPEKHRAPWLKKELAEIKRLVKANTPLSAISEAVGRSVAAIRQKASAEGISLRPKKSAR